MDIQVAMKTISRWFRKAKTATLMLPDGWFGKPYDNAHKLSHISVDNGELVLELDEHLRLRFRNVGDVRAGSSELSIDSFETLAFNWREYGTEATHNRTYTSGQVRLIHLSIPH